MKTSPSPVTDFFGTRLEPGALVDGLKAQGLKRFALILDDRGATLRLAAARGAEDAEARAETWLRGMLSPLLPCRVERVRGARAAALKGTFLDRRKPSDLVALAELRDESERPRAEAELAARLGPGAAPEFLSWTRPGGASGVRSAILLAASRRPRALAWLKAALDDESRTPAPEREVLIDGLEWGVARRPTVAVPGAKLPIVVDPERCSSCGVCAEVCPTESLAGRGVFAPGGVERCLSCFDCVEACPDDALRPGYGTSSATTSRSVVRRPGWLSRLRGADGPPLPAPFPPSFLLPRGKNKRPRRVLGLAVTTMQEHAAALLEGGRVAGAAEEERFSRVRHHGWKSELRPGSTLASDPTLCLEEVLSRRAIASLLSPRGLTLDDVDVFAVNGLPARYRRAYSALDASSPMPLLRAGRVVYAPHHLCHAASAWRVSGQRDSLVLTVDGRGDRETASVFRARRGKIRPVRDVLSLADRSIGGVYETVTRLLGFGAHGQGSVMALASFGTPAFDLSPFLSWDARRGPVIHERGLAERFAALARAPGQAPTRAGKDLAASLQLALEETLLGLLADEGAGRGDLCLAGGVALNCRMNARVRRTFRPQRMFVPPAANDAGTALGAALEAAALLGAPAAAPMEHAYWGPEFADGEIESALKRAGLEYRRSRDVAGEAAALLAGGNVACWFQGRMEFGPRALGARSILADPRRPEMHARVNAIKDREAWRPFGPSILAGREGDWFEGAFDTRFMLFALPFKPGRAEKVPAVAHVDGTSRPQSVHRDANPRYHALISQFEKRTGVPMVLNTSFNRRGEPIVCTPEDATDCFLGMPDADVLVAGPFIARRPAAPPRPARDEVRPLGSLPGGRRLMLRLTARCAESCAHCTLSDISHLKDRSFDDALRALAEGRRAGCSELVIMRGEAARWPGLADLLRRAREMGYGFLQLQTGGRDLAREELRRSLFPLLSAVELTLYSAEADVHDELTGVPGSLRETLIGARAAAAAGLEVVANVPVLRRNRDGLENVAVLAAKLGVRRVQFGFPRPVETKKGLEVSALSRLSDAAPFIRRALDAAARGGVAASTEGVPFCHLDPGQRRGPDAEEDWTRFRIDDLDRLVESLDPVRAGSRPEAPACRACPAREACPRTWALYLALFGSAELSPASL